MIKLSKLLTLAAIVAISFSSCTTYNKTMKTPNNYVEFYADDFEFSKQMKAEANSTKILGIDWGRLFTQKTGNINDGGAATLLSSIPVIGSAFSGDRTTNYALYELMEKNKGYDVVMYPQYSVKVSKPALGIGFLYSKTTVEVKARLGKLK